MPKFRKKPVVIEAVQWFCPEEFGHFKDGVYYNKKTGVDDYGIEHTVIDCGLQTLEGFMNIKESDWIITGVAGERYPCKNDIFVRTYDKVED